MIARWVSLALCLCALALGACAPEATPKPAPSAMPLQPQVVPSATEQPTSTTIPAPTATPTIAWAVLTDTAFGTQLRYPATWQPQAGCWLKYVGEDGFFQLDAIQGAGAPLDKVAQNEAAHHLQPYGSSPQISSLVVNGQPARLIWPSSDQAKEMQGQAAVIVQLVVPVGIAGGRYEFLILWADKLHVREIADSITLLAPAVTPAPPAVLDSVMFALVRQFDLPSADATLLSWEAVDWPNGCLGVPMRDVCTGALVPGFRLLVSLDGKVYEYRTDLRGERLLLANGPDHRIVKPALRWEAHVNGCQTLWLDAAGMAAIGPCDAPLLGRVLGEGTIRSVQWATIVARFAPFDVRLAQDNLVMDGLGQEPASPAWQRAVAAWAETVRRDLEGRSDAASWAFALRWHDQLPQAPGFCRFLQVDRSGYAWATTARCDGQEAQPLGDDWLTDEEMPAFDAWLYGLAPLQVSDLILSGLGSVQMEEEDMQNARRWAAAVHDRLAAVAPQMAGDSTGDITDGDVDAPSTGQHAYVLDLTVPTNNGTAHSVEQRFLLYLPPEYGQDRERVWPLVLFLHGSEERGNDPSLLVRQGIPKLIDQGQQFPFVVVSPQCRSGRWWWPQTDVLMALVEQLQKRLSIDSQRVYATGLSMGGFGVWMLGYRYPQRLAAIVPIAGGFYDGTANLPPDLCRMAELPVWAFHGVKDGQVAVGESQRVVDALRACGSKALLTLYPEAGHTQSWEMAYSDPALYSWLLEHALAGPS